MFWASKRTKTGKRVNPANRSRKSRLNIEALEPRCMLTGVVNVVLGAGNMTLVGDSSNNSVLMQYGSVAGAYVLTGQNGTLLELNGSGQTLTALPVNGVSGAIVVTLGAGGTKTFDFEGPTTSVPLAVPNLTIVNSAALCVNTINNVQISGPFTVTKAGGVVGECDLTIDNSTIVGPTVVSNTGGGGDSRTIIKSDETGVTTSLQGTFTLVNDNGNNSFQTSGTTQFGAGVFNPPGNPLPAVVTIVNGGASTVGSMMTFAGATTIFGAVTTVSAAHLPGFVDVLTFNGATVYGGVQATDVGGTTQVNVVNSSIDIQLASTNSGGMVIANNVGGVGAAQLTVTGSNLPWGLFVNNGLASTFGSTTNINSSTIGTRPGFGGPGTVVPPWAVLGDALTIVGENGNNNITIGSTGATTIGGIVDLGTGPNMLIGTNNVVRIVNTTMLGIVVKTPTVGAGNNSITLNNDIVQILLDIEYGVGTNTLNLAGANTSLPNPLTGSIKIAGTNGLDTLNTIATILPANVTGFVIVVQSGTFNP